MPAFFNLTSEGNLPDNFAVVAIGRRDYREEEYRNLIKKSIIKYSRFPVKDDIWHRLKNKIRYLRFNFLQDDYCVLNDYLHQIDANYHTDGNRIYYLAVAPEHFGVIVENLNKRCIKNNNGYNRCMIEKPFGSDLMTAKRLNRKITEVFSENNIYRIDHYLGKEMLQNIMVIRFANAIFEPLLNKQYIEQIQILSAETRGIGARGNYYDKAGEIRDMVQSHLLQLLSLIAMEKPKNYTEQEIRNEKVKVLKSIKKYNEDEVKNYVVRGQYGGVDNQTAYRDEPQVKKGSLTETYVALKLFIENNRWRGVPFYIRSGKRMPVKTTEIIIEFKNTAYRNRQIIRPNILIIKIQPEEGVFLRFNTKKIGAHDDIVPVKMDFCQNCDIGFNSPEAYEKLLFDAMRGDTTLFARWDEVEAAWEFIGSVLKAWDKEIPSFPNYRFGSWGPETAERLIKKDKKEWMVHQGE